MVFFYYYTKARTTWNQLDYEIPTLENVIRLHEVERGSKKGNNMNM